MKITAVSHLLSLTATLLTWGSPLVAGGPTPPSLAARDDAIRRFESRFIDESSTRYEHSNMTVKLVGYKKIIMTPDARADLEENIRQRPDEWEAFTNAYYDPHEKTMRIYFPVEGALLYHHGELIEASSLGEYPHEMIGGDCAVVGRYQTDQVTGLAWNKIKDGIIHLDEPSLPVRQYGNIFVYDLGWREGGHDHHRGRKRAEGHGGSCKQNHGGKVCSQVYKINHGRCPRDYSGCIDYNGWPKKDCNNHSNKWAFPGSDCFTSVARGHCWSEIPDKR
ncbi:hypothetical protein W97_06524 [Coniosporium apollinis CBS 100218]|uniref:Uncharacterized protein n=1 Tax=Coniosporium apollinis (strain CBS 100218) TaxID=1168221 RepID=R7Z029_CONA1|nr:uncharacterized protein W97_06524 [Coniosporium apollinis CBS 100218]EON67271.1 hypothetical protein W97_06524 [Coniosporium apollinis CBS 100218]